jgi:hypothetical protein
MLIWALQMDFYTQFLKANTSCQVGLQAFDGLKPYYVRQLKERNTCACKYHVDMVELKLGFNNMCSGSKGLHGQNCICDCDVCFNVILGDKCQAKKCQFVGLTNMWDSILCLVENLAWHNPNCVKGNCNECEINMLMTCPMEENNTSTSLMYWKCYELVIHGKTRARKDNKVLRL